MAKIWHEGKWLRVKVYRLPSHKQVYEYEKVYHHKTKNLELMWAQGIYPNGKACNQVPIPKAEFPHWHRRIEAGEARPELQRASEYTLKVKRGNVEAVLRYLSDLDDAQTWWQGVRV